MATASGATFAPVWMYTDSPPAEDAQTCHWHPARDRGQQPPQPGAALAHGQPDINPRGRRLTTRQPLQAVPGRHLIH